MTKLLRDLWIDERGIILSAELLIIATIMCCGVVVGWVVVRDAIVQELADVGNAISSLNQSYSFTGYNHSDGNKTLATCSGSSFTDTITLSQVSSTGASGANGGANLAGGFAAGAGASGARAAGASAARVQVNEFNEQAETKTAEVK
ncbi:MAG: hypothetical protein O3A00_12445, partial [Planctomycetota bacterium]|nr:hypothetical protein [Planctomycetota bacterium]